MFRPFLTDEDAALMDRDNVLDDTVAYLNRRLGCPRGGPTNKGREHCPQHSSTHFSAEVT